jgi:LemA protein
MSGWIIVGVLALFVLYFLWLYNRLVVRRNRVKNAWAQIDVQLRRRHELIPNLVASVKGYMQHERGIIDEIVAARRQAMAAEGDLPARMAAENALTRSMRTLFALTEAIPQLRANENMLSFQEELGSTENRIAFARQHYNDAVLEYNTVIETVPSAFVARSFGFRPEPLFEAEAAERTSVSVSF